MQQPGMSGRMQQPGMDQSDMQARKPMRSKTMMERRSSTM